MKSIIRQTADWLEQYIIFPEENQSIVVAAWVAATHIWPSFDSFPYLVITARTKRAGKTRLGVDLVQHIVSNGHNSSQSTAAALFRKITAEKPTLIMDEAESHGSEAKSALHGLMNLGYRKGQKITRSIGKTDTIDYEVYCPKVFILIGDPSDTIRDRSIVITLARSLAEPPKRYSYTEATAEGVDLGTRIHDVVEAHKSKIVDNYINESAAYLVSDRDEEIWRSILATAKALDPKVYEMLKRAAVDISTEKTAPKRAISLEEETIADRLAYSQKLLTDCAAIFNRKGAPSALKSGELLDALYALDLSPWRKYKGTGLTMNEMAHILAECGVVGTGGKTTKTIRNGKELFRGYTREQINTAAKKIGA